MRADFCFISVVAAHVLALLVGIHLLVGLMDEPVEIMEGREAEDVADGGTAAMRLHALLYVVDDGDGLLVVAARHEHEEFIAAEAEDVVLAGDVREDVGDGLYEQVAARMAEGVVHLLEPVDVDEDDGVHRAGLQALVDKITEGASVADACELVDCADLVQFLDVVAVAHHDGGDAQDDAAAWRWRRTPLWPDR